ncbi:glycerate kinase [Corynebacterium cystitidis]|uniref:Glycerate kinase n=1 Tax=Corynebacterium cystitidis DSM 20524 TaxID=1121357 RepID=A0A1H9NVG5_9CORY|nr:glycerate kinase [Corynebacterium cystitidis]WJY82714.1 Glycerate kinase [Corynebacterium cystitidis DSM 20524]SER39940.1 glycerate kinase [Corynebacterium cystitidis DSM 20524]SNV71462.1 glycerate kinase [Corynebacterium cystitidis]
MTDSAHSPLDSLSGARAEDLTIVIAPDSFKGTASADQAAQWLGEGVRQIIANADIVLAPMADGGEGTSELFEGERITLPTTDAAGRLTEATYVYHAASTTAYIDVAAASGLPAVADNPVAATGDTYGTGVLIADAQTRGATRIVLGLGGSATVDGGTGILVAFGINPINQEGYTLRTGGTHLRELHDFDTATMNIPAAGVEWVLAADVTSPVTGPKGAAHVFGPQKGATAEEVELLDEGLARLCAVTGIAADTPGFGAAGAVPVGITWVSQLLYGNSDNVHLVSGAQLVADALGLPEKISQASLVITGEGKYDDQTAAGKVVDVVARLARESDVPVAIASGRFEAEVPEGAIAVELEAGLDVAEQMRRAGARIAVDYLNISTVQG